MEMVVVVLAWIVGSYVVLDFGFGAIDLSKGVHKPGGRQIYAGGPIFGESRSPPGPPGVPSVMVTYARIAPRWKLSLEVVPDLTAKITLLGQGSFLPTSIGLLIWFVFGPLGSKVLNSRLIRLPLRSRDDSPHPSDCRDIPSVDSSPMVCIRDDEAQGSSNFISRVLSFSSVRFQWP
ncbi:hypothetical protein FA13DRAFT_304268 [Coprinellus micaceus]|uniref:Uncharacterized protein n=1 Tax=Coprinellus micaceus TaxID=71717 RepID=A0A4Y7SDJ3_COPMI|nr:hypothetical protein FA13DRAFT_304268 [Coprinellus micaceus]